jgi:hypothetical protein
MLRGFGILKPIPKSNREPPSKKVGSATGIEPAWYLLYACLSLSVKQLILFQRARDVSNCVSNPLAGIAARWLRIYFALLDFFRREAHAAIWRTSL